MAINNIMLQFAKRAVGKQWSISRRMLSSKLTKKQRVQMQANKNQMSEFEKLKLSQVQEAEIVPIATGGGRKKMEKKHTLNEETSEEVASQLLE